MYAASSPRQDRVPVEEAQLFTREVGEGPPIVVLHGGPDFDHHYLVPELDRLAEAFRLVYYDQRGRGRSADGVDPEDVSLDSELEDVEAVRRSFGLERTAVLGHSWGGHVALAYAVRHPDRVSHLILLNTAPASHDGMLLLREHVRLARPAADTAALESLSATRRYLEGDLNAEAEYYRLHFRFALRRADHLELIVARLRANFTPERVIKARAIEHRLYALTWGQPAYDLLPALRELDVPTLVLHGADDVIPVEIPERIAASTPGARLTVLDDCGHFSYLERPDEVYREVAELFVQR